MPRSSLNEEPRLEHIRDLYEHIQTDAGWQRQRALDTQLLNLYFGDNPVPVPNTRSRQRHWQFDPVKMNLNEAARIIDLFMSFYPEPARIGVVFTGEGQRSDEQAEKAEQAINEAIDQLNPATDSPHYRQVFQMLLLGREAWMIAPGNQYWYDFPFKREDETEQQWADRFAGWKKGAPLPLLWTDLPAQSTFPASLSTVDDEVLSYKTVTYVDLMEIFSAKELGGDPPREDWLKHTNLIIYSNREYIGYATLNDVRGVGIGPFRLGGGIEDRLLRTVEHKLGRPAIRILPGMTSGRKEPGFFWKSVLSVVREMLQQADELASIVATANKTDALPWMAAYLNDALGEGAKARLDEAAMGDFIPLDPGDRDAGRGRESIEPIHIPKFAEGTARYLQFWLGRIAQISGALESLEGAFGPSGMPAWSRNFSAQLGKAKLRNLTTARIGADIEAAEMISRSVVSFGEPITLARLDQEGNRRGDIVLKPEELKRFRPVLKGTFEARVPIDERADFSLAMDMMANAKSSGAPLPPRWVFSRLLGEDNFWELYREWLEWEYINTPAIRELQTKHIADRFEAQLGEDAGMALGELENVEGLPDTARQVLMERASQNGQRRISPDDQGRRRAGGAFQGERTGPRTT